MNETIKPLKKLPSKIMPGGDYASTQYALILGLVSNEEIIIRNYNAGKDTADTIGFMNSIGCKVDRSATEIRITPVDDINIPECAELVYSGGILPLVQLIGFLTGKNISCTLAYSKKINPDSIDFLVKYFNKNGVDLSHEADSGLIVFRGGCMIPDECVLSSALPYLKNCLLMYGLASGQSLVFKEKIFTDDSFEKIIELLGGTILSHEVKSVMAVDPKDPRKKIRLEKADYRRKVELPRASGIKGGEISIPSDFHTAAALMLLAVLKRGAVTIENISPNQGLNRFIKFLKSSAADIETSNKKINEKFTTYDITVSGLEIKGRKISGNKTLNLLTLIPYLAVAGCVGTGNTMIRDAAEYGIWQNSPFGEISSALKNIGIKSGALEDGLIIEGKLDYEEDQFGPYQNRETALAFYILALSDSAKTEFRRFELISENYPELVENMKDAYELQLLSKQI